MDAHSPLQMLRQVNPGQLPREELTRLFTMRLDLCEQLLAEQDQLRQALAALEKG